MNEHLASQVIIALRPEDKIPKIYNLHQYSKSPMQ
uniref:Uncharacterized protein n=1 Tax=Rhizophora mucronata TaxID=61149 RepID=A0A2P2R3V5_RHIMU